MSEGPAKNRKSSIRRFMPAVLLATLAGLLFAGAAGCSREPAKTEAAAVDEKRHPLVGEIISVDTEHQALLVKHQAIAGYMPAMTMLFQVSAGDLANAKPGQHIRAELVEDGDGDVHLEKIWPDDTVSKDLLAAGARTLREDTASRGKSAYREVGELMPGFSLANQEGEVVTADRFRGRQVMVNFIYTRCPIPNMCPLATTKMLQTQKLAREEGVKDIEFISISLDPAYDSPGVLKDYARSRAIDTSNFSFLTGPEPAVKDLLTQFGVLTQLEGGLIKHTLATLLIDAKGRIIHRADGSQWEPREFVERMKR